jgi:hypothetical protein
LERSFERPYARADALPTSSGVQRLLRDWLDRCAEHLTDGGLPQMEHTLTTLVSAASERTLALNPGARARILAADFAGALARTLRGGIADEFGWPALEAAHTRGMAAWFDNWPYVVLADASRALVIGPDEVVLEHELRWPAHAGTPSPVAFVYADGQLLVASREASSSSTRAYWSGQPRRFFDAAIADSNLASAVFASIELASGGRTRGGRAVRAGDTQISDRFHVFADGSTFWRQVGARELREFDPVSGRAGRVSLPASISSLASGCAAIDLAACSLLPLNPGLERTPLGQADGLLGWTVADRGALNGWHARRIDGLELRGHLAGTAPLGLVDMPAAQDGPRPLSRTGNQLSLWSPDGSRELFRGAFGRPSELAAGSPLVLPPQFWHCLRVRDPAGSQALRSLTEGVAHELVNSAHDELASGQTALEATLALIEKLLPQVSHPRLRTGIAAICGVVARLAQRRADLAVSLASRGHAR